MPIISLIVSFIVYPFYSSLAVLRDLLKDKKFKVDVESMQDNLYVMNFFMSFGKYLILILSAIACIVGTYVSKRLELNPIISFIFGMSSFIVTYWLASIVVFSVQVISWLSTAVRKVSKEVEQMSKRTDEEPKKMVH